MYKSCEAILGLSIRKLQAKTEETLYKYNWKQQ